MSLLGGDDPQRRLVDNTLLVLGARVMAIVGPLVAAWFFKDLVGGISDLKTTVLNINARIEYQIVPKLGDVEGRITRLERSADVPRQ